MSETISVEVDRDLDAELDAAAADLSGLSMRKAADLLWVCLESLTRRDVPGPVAARCRAIVQVGGQVRALRDWMLIEAADSDAGPQATRVLGAIAVTSPSMLAPRLAGAAAMLMAAYPTSPVAMRALLEISKDDSLGQIAARTHEAGVPAEEVLAMLRETRPMAEEILTDPTANPGGDDVAGR